MTNFERALADIARAAKCNASLGLAALRPLRPISDQECRELAKMSPFRFEFLRSFYPRPEDQPFPGYDLLGRPL